MATIGRQGLHLNAGELHSVSKEFGLESDSSAMDRILDGGYAEEFLKFLGAADVHSFDNSAYEYATHLHDMNRPLPSEFREKYSVVLDGGSLEHVFNFPQAIKNCMEMVEVGGHFLAITPANNFFGHGFYQFSPELFFSIFSEANGFEITSMIAFESGSSNAKWYLVKNPQVLKSRVTLENCEPVYLLVISKKLRAAEIFQSTPQQSDYVSAWADPSRAAASTAKNFSSAKRNMSVSRAIWMKIPKPLRRAIKELMGKSCFDPRFFEPIDPATRE